MAFFSVAESLYFKVLLVECNVDVGESVVRELSRRRHSNDTVSSSSSSSSSYYYYYYYYYYPSLG
jgi:hypothetical protein